MSKRQPLPNLTTIRLVAALYVFCFHFVPASHTNMGFTGVNLFFVLSGFILAYNHPSVTDKRRFYALRFARIYPLYALSLLLALPQALHGTVDRDMLLLRVPMTFALLQTWWPPFRNTLNSVAWTLPIEAFFYLCFPFLVPLTARCVPHWKRWIAVLGAVLLLPPVLVDCVLIPRHPALDIPLRLMLTTPPFHMAEFLIGMVLGLRFLEERPVFRGWQVALATVLLIAGTLACYPMSWNYRDLMLNGLLAIPYGVLLYLLAGWTSRWFGHPLLQLGGEISFGIYLLQFTAAAAARVVTHQSVPHWSVVLAILMVASYLSFMYLEKPARRFILSALGVGFTQKPIATPGLAP